VTAVNYELRGAAVDLWNYKGTEVVISGPAGTGKTVACLLRLHLLALNNPGFRGLILRKTGVSLTSTTLVTFRKQVILEAARARLVRFHGGSQEVAAGYKYANGSDIDVSGLDKPEKILSSEYDMIFIDECTEVSIDDWEFALSRLRHGLLSWQQLMGACNPNSPTHWIKFRESGGNTPIFISTHMDNPAYVKSDGTFTPLGDNYINGVLDGLTGVRRLRLKDGMWAAAEGIIYTQWNERKLLIPSFKIPDDWDRYWGLDFGFNNPSVCSMYAKNPDGKLFLYRETYVSNKIVEQWAWETMMKVRTKGLGTWYEPKPRKVIADHDAEDRETFTKKTGLPTYAADKRVSVGIQAVQKRMKEERLFIFNDALIYQDRRLVDRKVPTCTSEEIPGYVWAKKKASDGTVNEKDEPLKENDHGCDVMRYVVMEVDTRGTAGVRFL
jgi:phage terminase large subunit